MDSDVQKWVDLSSYDIETAEAMINSERLLYIVFCCQQALEKILKAKVTQVTRKLPPKTHDLAQLSGLANIKLDNKKQLFYNQLTAYYIESRYPDEIGELAKRLNKETAQSYLTRTKSEIAWIKSLLK
jgi:HEPN domain-containing protein